MIEGGKYCDIGCVANGEGIGADIVDCWELTEEREASELELWKTEVAWEEDVCEDCCCG